MGSVDFLTGEANGQELTCSFSQEELDHPGMVALVKHKIEDISPGFSSHRAGVLKAALKKGFELKKKKKQPPGVLLRCPNLYDCPRYANPVSLSEIGTTLICSCSEAAGRGFCK